MKKAIVLFFVVFLFLPSLVIASPLIIDWSQFDFEKMASGDPTIPPNISVPSDTTSMEICILLGYQIETDEGTNYIWSSSNESSVHVYVKGKLQATGTGKATITGKDQNGVGKDIKINVTVPKFYLSDTKITVSSAEGAYFIAQVNGGASMTTMSTAGDAFSVSHVDTGFGPYPNIYRIIPLKVGSGSIKFTLNGRSAGTIAVTVEESAFTEFPDDQPADIMDNSNSSVPNKESSAPYVLENVFPGFDYDSIVATPDTYAGEMFILSGTVLHVSGSNEEGYSLIVAVNHSTSEMILMRVEPEFAPSFNIREFDTISALVGFVKMYDFISNGKPVSAPLTTAALVFLEE